MVDRGLEWPCVQLKYADILGLPARCLIFYIAILCIQEITMNTQKL
jgi:hypothetical protein